MSQPREEKDRLREEENPIPANPDMDGKGNLPDPDRTDPSTLPRLSEEIDKPVDETNLGEHRISGDHAEPTDVTRTSNDNYIEGKYIDIGGGD